MKSLVFSERADTSFEHILEWTLEKFGPQQVEIYHDKLLERCQAIVQGTAPNQSCRAMFADDLREDLRFTRGGSTLSSLSKPPTPC